jgi:hypothetical protein
MEVLNISQLAQDVWDGNESPLKAYAIAKEYLKQATEALKAIEEAALEEASKYDKTFEAEGFKFERRNGARQWSFKTVKEWSEKKLEQKQELKEIEDKYKSVYKSFESGITSVDDFGEVMQLPDVTYKKDVLIVKGL